MISFFTQLHTSEGLVHLIESGGMIFLLAVGTAARKRVAGSCEAASGLKRS